MTTSTTVPVTVSAEARVRLAELGMQVQLEQMIEQARQVLPELARIEVVLNERYDMGGEPGVAIETYGKDPSAAADRIFWKLAERMVASFPPEVLEHLSIDFHPGEPHAW